MHLTYYDLVECGEKLISPFNIEQVNPASYDLTLSENAILASGEEVKLPYSLKPGEFILVSSIEYFKFPCDVSGQLLLKSTIGRSAIDHMLAGWFDPDFHGNATMELKNDGINDFLLTPGMRVAQMIFPMLLRPTKPYRVGGRYHGQKDVTPKREALKHNEISNIHDDSDPWILGPFLHGNFDYYYQWENEYGQHKNLS